MELAEEMLRNIVEIHGPDSIDAAGCRTMLAVVYIHLGRWSEAQEHINKSLQTLGEPDFVNGLFIRKLRLDLVMLYLNNGRIEDAENAIREVLHALGPGTPEHPVTLQAHQHMLTIYLRIDR
jgi:Tfp pilus assembly protein PilF